MGKSSPTTMQAKHIPDIVMLETIVSLESRWKVWVSAPEGGRGLHYRRAHSANLMEIEVALRPIPPKIILSKLRKLVRRGLIDGCPCGCSGQFKIRRDENAGQ